MRPNWFGLFWMLLAMLAVSACRSRDRSAQIAAEIATVHVTLHNLENSDRDKSNYQYLISDCGSGGTVSGRLLETDKVEYKVKGLKPGMSCRVRVENQDADLSQIRFRTDEKVFYDAPAVAVSLDVKGQLVGAAILKRTYEHLIPEDSKKRFSISAKVEFPDDAPDGLEPQLSCSPELFTFAAGYVPSSKRAGTFTFGAILDTDGKEYTCKWLHVYRQSVQIYTAALQGSAGIVVKSAAGQLIPLGTTAIVLRSVSKDEANGVVVTTQQGTCKANEVFNVETRSCQASVNP